MLGSCVKPPQAFWVIIINRLRRPGGSKGVKSLMRRRGKGPTSRCSEAFFVCVCVCVFPLMPCSCSSAVSLSESSYLRRPPAVWACVELQISLAGCWESKQLCPQSPHTALNLHALQAAQGPALRVITTHTHREFTGSPRPIFKKHDFRHRHAHTHFTSVHTNIFLPHTELLQSNSRKLWSPPPCFVDVLCPDLWICSLVRLLNKETETG